MEDAIDAITSYEPGESEKGSADEEQAKAQVTAAEAAATRQAIQATFIEETTKLHANHRATMTAVSEWRNTLEVARERTRQSKQKGRITEAITQVQISTANKKTDMAET
jgi:hypothetical protein